MTTEKEVKKQEGQEQADERQKGSPEQTLIEKLLGEVHLYHTPNKVAYCAVNVGDRVENYPVKSEDFLMTLARQFYLTYGAYPKTSFLNKIQGQLSWMARLDGPEFTFHTRYAKVENAIWCDLCDRWGHYVKIDPNGGWSIHRHDLTSMIFIRHPSMKEQVHPQKGGSIKDLAQFLNIQNEAQFILIVAFILIAMNPDGPFPILTLHGPQGASKSTMLRIIRSLIDPSEAPLNSGPGSVRDLFIHASHDWMPCIDNVSTLSDKMSDAYCQLVTEGVFRARTIYTDLQETIIKAKRPVAFNGIASFARQNDLLDRSIFLYLSSITATNRKPESEFWTAWEKAKPKILGAFYDALSFALRNIDHVKLDSLPRMADFARFVVAAEPACPWAPGAFIRAYEANRADMVDMALESDPIGDAILNLMEDKAVWSNTSTELLNTLKTVTPDLVQKDKDWPKAPNALSNRLMRLEGFLGNKGIEIVRVRQPHSRLIVLKKVSPNSTSEKDWTPESEIKEDVPFVLAKVSDNEEIALEETEDDIEESSPVEKPAIIKELTIVEGKVYEEGEV